METTYRREVSDRVSSLAYSTVSRCCLATTLGSGAFMFDLNRDIHETEQVVTYAPSIFDFDPLVSSCFLGMKHQYIAVGSYNGGVSVLSKQSKENKAFYSTGYTCAVHSLQPVPHNETNVLVCTKYGAEVVDMDTNQSVVALEDPAPRAIGAVSLSPTAFAVANYDGSVLLYDSRTGSEAVTVLSVPDQLMSLAVCEDTREVCVGTVAGRVFTLRCVHSELREQAFATGKVRSPVTAACIRAGKIVVGDLAGRVSIIDTTPKGAATRYWTAESLLVSHESVALRERSPQQPHAARPAVDAEVTALSLAEDSVWVSFSTNHPEMTSHVIPLPV
ncbi:hypothetical protein STCU_04029 [Strigomonas culicis]|uniref:Guanine nucleotide-binding protein subunit beta-like protein n=1 Tax=Strigomonas culicis TaxID=28005 RepID=S9UNL8_9TRYP|nr:hypothetical protein STCU_06498 [Strigomonas culicis]EPY30513.1 hypothetical protein STCU_04029 [Strigomonas culicis]|eukprot:EPY25745.1 hypothetical protein STCU_06498 [Strigomonas culicis]